MKKTAVIIAAVALASFSLSACQKSPEKPIVQSKDLDNMIENAIKEQTGGDVQGDSISEKVGSNEIYSKELADKHGKVTIHVNAQITTPEINKVPIQRVERGKFTQETVDILRDRLVKGDLFAGSDEMSKVEMQETINILEDLLSGKMPKPEGRPFNKEQAEKDLETFKNKLADMPDSYDTTPISGKLEPFKESIFSAGERLLGFAQSEEGGYESFKVYNDYKSCVYLVLYNSEKNTHSDNMGYFITKEAASANSFPTSAEIAEIPDISITKEEARKQADALIADLGIDYLSAYSVEKMYGGSDDIRNPRKCVWYLRYVRTMNGIPVTYTPYDCMKTENDAQSAPWSYEDMVFAVDDSGIVGFRWSSPYKLTEVVTENSNLLPFQDIADVFDTMALVINAWDGISANNPRLTGVQINVDEIKFGLTRVTEQNKRDSGLLVPVWDFFGTMTYIQEVEGEAKKSFIGDIPILTVNAIDGSIINRNLGY